MLTHVLHPASWSLRSAEILSEYGAANGSILMRKSSFNEIRVIPYSFSSDISFNCSGKSPFVKAVHLILELLSNLMIFILISVTSGYPYIKGSVVKHSCTDEILSLNFGISLLRISIALTTNFGSHHSSYDLTLPNRFAIIIA